MPKHKITLTDEDLRTIRRALDDAIQWQSSLADAYPASDPYAKAARKRAARAERLHRKLFGTPSDVQQQEEADRRAPSVNIFELMAGK